MIFINKQSQFMILKIIKTKQKNKKKNNKLKKNKKLNDKFKRNIIIDLKNKEKVLN